MAPKPGNAFAQQKELLRHKYSEIRPREEDPPSTPMTTMSMFIRPDLLQINHEEPAEPKTPTNIDPLHKPAIRDILGKRAFTDPLGAPNAYSTSSTGPSSFGKQSSGVGYIKSKFTGKTKKNKTPEQPPQGFNTQTPSEYLSNTTSSVTRPKTGTASDVLSGVSIRMASQFAAHENRYREEFNQMNTNLLTLNENFHAVQCNMNKQMAQINRKIDILLEAQGLDVSSGGQHLRQDRGTMEQKLREEVHRRRDDIMDPAVTAANQEVSNAAAAVVSETSSPTNQNSTPATNNRKMTPRPPKLPIMAATLTSTPPHVPQLPQPESSSFARVTITDPSLSSPSVVRDARRMRQVHRDGQRDAGTEERRADIVAKGLANDTRIQGPGSLVHPALRYQEDIDKLTGGKGKTQVAQKKTEDDGNEVLWRRPSDNGEIGGRWYKAAMQQ